VSKSSSPASNAMLGVATEVRTGFDFQSLFKWRKQFEDNVDTHLIFRLLCQLSLLWSYGNEFALIPVMPLLYNSGSYERRLSAEIPHSKPVSAKRPIWP